MRKNDWRANALICLYVVMISGSMGKVIPLVTAIDHDIGTRPTQSAWLISIMSVVGIVIAPLAGRLTLRFTDRALITAGVAIGAAGSGAAALGTSFVTILGGRLIEGVAFFLILNSAMTLLMTVNDGTNRSRALSLYIASIPFGIGLFSMLAARVSGSGWQAAFIVHAVILTGALLATRLLPGVAREHAAMATPAMPAEPFRRMPPVWLGLSMALAGAAQFGASALLPTYLVQAHGLGLVEAASIGSLGLALGIAGNLVAGFLLGRGFRSTVLAFAMIGAAAAAGIVTFFPAAGVTANAAAYVMLLLFGGGANSAIVSFGPLVTPNPVQLGRSNAILNQINNGGMLFAAPVMFFAYANGDALGSAGFVLACAAGVVLIMWLSGLTVLDATHHAEAGAAGDVAPGSFTT